MSGNMQVAENVKSAEICAVIIRADGTKVDLGRISYYHKSWYKRFAWKIKKFIVDLLNKLHK